jgi:oxaloacetate decarboxylase alpha subunit
VDGHAYQVVVAEGDVTLVPPVTGAAPKPSPPASVSNASAATDITAGLAGTIHQVLVSVGDVVNEGQVVCILEAMKMETEVRAVSAGTVSRIGISVGDSVTVGQSLMSLN